MTGIQKTIAQIRVSVLMCMEMVVLPILCGASIVLFSQPILQTTPNELFNLWVDSPFVITMGYVRLIAFKKLADMCATGCGHVAFCAC